MSSAPSSLSLWDRARSSLYDRAVTDFTSRWYRAVLDRIPPHSHILDVGIGTGTALLANVSTLREKSITVLGVDYDAAYIQQCHEHILRNSAVDHVTAVQADIHQFRPPDSRLFDHIYFSGSFMILPDQSKVLKRVLGFLRDHEDGRIYFTQTFELQKNLFMEWIKPKLLAVTSIDFGKVSYEGDFDDVLHEAGISIEDMALLNDGKKVEGVRESRLVCARSSIYSPNETESAI